MKRLFLAISAFAILSIFASCVSTEAAPEETALVEDVDAVSDATSAATAEAEYEDADATSAATDATSGATGED
jgi:hypothetical protein